MKLLGSGPKFGAQFTYRVQDGRGGIPAALYLAKDFVANDKCIVILGDNVMENSIKKEVDEFVKGKTGAKVYLQKVKDPQRYGVAEVKTGKVVACYEKPEKPVTDLAILGVYMLDKKAFDVIPTLKPSKRGELEITDILNFYIKNDDLSYGILGGFWIDAGTFEALHRANNFAAQKSGYSDKGPFK